MLPYERWFVVVVNEQDVQQLKDVALITAVAVRYCSALDTRNWDALEECFTPDVSADYAGHGLLAGLSAVQKACRDALEPLAVSQHLLGNHQVAVDGDAATHECYFQAQHIRPETPGGCSYLVAGRYRDRLTRQQDGWRIRHRELQVLWTTGNPAVLSN